VLRLSLLLQGWRVKQDRLLKSLMFTKQNLCISKNLCKISARSLHSVNESRVKGSQKSSEISCIPQFHTSKILKEEEILNCRH
jgi:hypothetical protein